MKQKWILLGFVLCIGFYSKAQELHLGVTADINLNKMNAKGLSNKLQTGYNGGAYAELTLSRKISLQPEVLYTQLNVQKSDNFNTYYVNSGRSFANTDISLHYLSVPLLVNYRISDLLTVNAGPEWDYLLFSNDNLLKSNATAFQKNNAGVVAGVKASVSPSFSFFGSYYYSLSNMNNIDNRYQWHSNQVRLGIQVRVW